VDFSNHALQKFLGAFEVPSEEANHTRTYDAGHVVALL
jgi:hypothetical protein